MGRPKSPINGAELPVGKPFKQGEQQREIARRGGQARQRKRKQLCTLREQLEMLLAEERTDKNGKVTTVQAGMTAALVKAAFEGNTKAYEIIRDTIGQKPSEKVEVSTIDKNVVDDVDSFLYGED